MTANDLFNYYNNSTTHDHLNCSVEVVETFLKEYPELRHTSLEHADICFYNYMWNLFFN